VPTLHLVSHTHWDREWYLTFQQFRLKLVRALDELLEIFAEDAQYRAFMLDGQTILLEDYLAMRSEKASALRQAVRAGRLLIGPWHVMVDEFLVSPEAIVRNLLQGERSARAFGPKMQVGYTPDPFGHIAQMPQILRGFGIQTAALMRGLADEPCELWWDAPDGSRVLLANLRDGYDNASQLPVSLPEQFVAEVQRLEEALQPYVSTSHILLMQGDDHAPPVPGTPAAIAYADARLDGSRLLHSTLPDYMNAIGREISVRRIPVPVVHGELRACKRSPLLPGVLSTRMWIKQRNHADQRLLERWAEPYAVWAGDLLAQAKSAGAVPENGQQHLSNTAPILRYAWKQLMECHFHDSICGSGIDAVHAEMRTRFDQVEQIGEEITRQSLNQIAALADTADGAPAAAHACLVAFNASPFEQTGVVSGALRLPAGLDGFQLVDEDGQPLPFEIAVRSGKELANIDLDRDGLSAALGIIQEGRLFGLSLVEVGFRRRGEALLIDLILDEYQLPDARVLDKGLKRIYAYLEDPTIVSYKVRAREVPVSDLRWLARDVPAYGIRRAWTVPSEDPPPSLTVTQTDEPPPDNLQTDEIHLDETQKDNRIENEYLLVEASQKDGTLRLTDKRSGVKFNGLNRFIDGGDRGDEYNYEAPQNDVPADVRMMAMRSIAGAMSQSLRIDLILEVPVSLAEDRAARSTKLCELPVAVTATLIHGSPRLDLHVEVENTARDHRLRVHFPTPFVVGSYETDGHFRVARRQIGLPEYDDTWEERPRPEVPQRLFTGVSDDHTGLMLANQGLPEIEVFRDEAGHAQMALTLLRCVGWLSRNDLTNRKGLAGPPLETPDAQMPGQWNFDYALIPHTGDFRQAWDEAHAFDLPMRAAVTGVHTGLLRADRPLLTVSPTDFLITAIKEAENGRGMILRGYNPNSKAMRVSVTPWKKFNQAWRVRLDETHPRRLEIRQDGSIAFLARGHEIVTLRLA
jgi:mannosylglycerate hydrolase